MFKLHFASLSIHEHDVDGEELKLVRSIRQRRTRFSGEWTIAQNA